MTQPSRMQLVGQLQRPGQKPENIEFFADQRPILTEEELAAGIGWVDGRYPPFDVRRYGAESQTDSTDAIRKAFSVAKAAGGGTVYIPAGTYFLSTSDTPAYCLRIPSNTHVVGDSSTNTILTRTVANVDEASILLVNDDADTATGYDGAGNIEISNLTFRDSLTAERTTGTGDLIALGHCDKAVVRDCRFGKHAQHCVDVAGSRDVKVIDCIEDNDNGLTGYAANASVQADRAVTNAFIGINGDNTETTDLLIQGNTFRSANTNEILHIGHNGGTVSNITVKNNYLQGTSRSFASLIRCDQTDTSIDGLIIEGNIIDCTTANNAAIAIDTDGNLSESIKNVVIKDNIIKGTARIGIFIGVSDDFTQSTFPAVNNIGITGNSVDIDATSSTVSAYGIWAALCESITITENNVAIERDTDTIPVYGILTTSCIGSKINNNVVKPNLTGTYVGTQITASIALGRYSGILTSTPFTMEASHNDVYVSDFRYGLAATGMDSLGIDLPKFSGNTFIGALTNGDAHIHETLRASDGTNGMMDVDFGSGVFTQTLALDTVYAISTGLIKTSVSNVTTTPSTFNIVYTPGASSTLATTSESLIANQADIGLQVITYDATAGTFDLVTGSTGTQLSIVQGGADLTRTGGNISMRFAI